MNHAVTILAASPVEVKGQSARRPNELRLQHSISADIMIDESLEGPNFETFNSAPREPYVTG